MRIAVDGEQCMGHGRCYRLMPDLLSFDDEGFVTIRDQTVEVPVEQEHLAEEAEGSCPEGAISLIANDRA
jgi:ferredoxin